MTKSELIEHLETEQRHLSGRDVELAVKAMVEHTRKLFSFLVETLMAITGGCFCGKVTYRINGKLRDARSCHCSRCRKAFSSQASAYAEVAPDTLEWLSGEDLLTTYESDHGFGLRFCSQCGSTLCGMHRGKVHGVALGCVDGDPQVEIGMHIFVGSKAAWEVIPEGAIQFDEGPPD